jgi:small GTP-binding protein
MLKVAVLGKGMVGKSSLTYKFINCNTPKDHDPTIEDKYSTVTCIDGSNYEVEILDTAGQDDYQSLMNYWITFGQAFILVYAINDKESFDALEDKREKILKMKKDEVCPIVIVGNKCDLESQRVVRFEDAIALAKKWGCSNFETSVIVNILLKD